MKWLRCSVALISCVFCCDSALALDPILVEFGWSQPDPVTLPANYATIVSGNPWDGIFGVDTLTQFPNTRFADALAVVLWNQACAAGSACSVGFSSGGQYPFAMSPEQNLDQILGGPNKLWADGWDGNPTPFSGSFTGTFHAATYVPQKAVNMGSLYGYQITAVEREVTATTQTIRLYGISVPEPSTMLLALLGLCASTTRVV